MTKEMLIWLSKWANRKVKGRSFKEALAYDGISLWWFIKFSFYNRAAMALKGMKVRESSVLKIKRSRAAKYVLLAKSLVRTFLGRLAARKTGESKMGHKIMTIGYSIDWGDTIASKSKSDITIGDVVTELKKRGHGVIALDHDTSPFVDFRTLFEKAAYEKRLWRPVEAYLTSDIIKKSLKAGERFEKTWQKLKNDPDFRNSLKYEDFQLFDLLKDDFEEFFKSHLFYHVLCLELMKRAIEVEKPQLILATCEYSSLGKAAVTAGRLKSVPILALQHGNITPYHAGYYCMPDEISDKLAPQYCSLPDKTAVFGDYSRRILTETCNYPPESVVVTGQPRYDVLTRIDEMFEREKIFRRISLDPYKKTIVLATGAFQAKYGYPDYDEPLLDATFKATTEIPNAQLVIKLHPREDGELQRRMVVERGLKDILITKGKLYELLYICDVLITFCSVVATEAFILGKPVIIVNLTGEPDPIPYATSGAAIGVYHKQGLMRAIKDVLENSEVRRKLEENRKKFLHEHVHTVDGQASKRVATLIEQMIGEIRR